jgi:hypothetical protein
MGRGLSDLQRKILEHGGGSPADLALALFGDTAPGHRVSICRAQKSLEQRGLLALTNNSPRWQLSVNERCRVEQAEAMAFLGQLAPLSNDLVIFSPPYLDARRYKDGDGSVPVFRDPKLWARSMTSMMQTALRSCRGLVACVANGRTKNFRYKPAVERLIVNLDDAGVCLREPPIYLRMGIPGSSGDDWLKNCYETIVCVTHGGRLPWSNNKAMGKPPKLGPGDKPPHRRQDGRRAGPEVQHYKHPDIANPGNVIHCKVGGGRIGDKLAHENEAPFPEELVEFFVRSFCPPGGIVCDPFCGSGTTGVVALRWGRRFMGCDMRLSQVELTRRRLARVPKENP